MMQESKAINSLFALACGDAYGNAYEMDGLVGETFNKASLPDEAKIKNYTDDTKMAMILWKHYSEHNTIKEDKLFEAYAEWAEKDGYADGIGIHTAAVLLEGKTDKSSQGNGVLMRVLPFGLRLIEEGVPFDDAVDMINIDASLTHDNEVIRITNRLCLDIAVNGLDVLNKDDYTDILSQLKTGYSAWVIYTVNDVLDVLKMDTGLLDGFKELVSRGGDTDTNCAIYGAIRGYRDEFDLNLKDFIMNPSELVYLEAEVSAKPLSKESIQELLEFLPYFVENNKFEKIDNSGRVKGIFEYPEYTDEVLKFRSILSSTRFLVNFNWVDWTDGRKIASNFEKIAQSDLLTLRMLVMALIRNDRFCVGAFLDALEHGVMREILLRLKVIAADESLL